MEAVGQDYKIKAFPLVTWGWAATSRSVCDYLQHNLTCIYAAYQLPMQNIITLLKYQISEFGAGLKDQISLIE